MTEESVDWVNGDEVVVKRQLGIRIFWNARGGVAITQEADDYHQDDPVVYFDPENLKPIIERLQAMQNEWAAG